MDTDPQRRNLRFEFAFQCITKDCGRIIEQRTFRAIVEGPGLEVVCTQCAQLYLVSIEGATPITPEMLAEAMSDQRENYYRRGLPPVVDQALTAGLLRDVGIYIRKRGERS